MEPRKPFAYLTEDEQLSEYPLDERCGDCCSCRWWAEIEGPTWNEPLKESDGTLFLSGGKPVQSSSWDGHCHRYPPVIPPWNKEDCEAWYPATSARDWCGEYQKAD